MEGSTPDPVSQFQDISQIGAFSGVGKGAASFCNVMLKLCVRHDYPFATANIKQVLADFTGE